jgi:hypothetical protein
MFSLLKGVIKKEGSNRPDGNGNNLNGFFKGGQKKDDQEDMHPAFMASAADHESSGSNNPTAEEYTPEDYGLVIRDLDKERAELERDQTTMVENEMTQEEQHGHPEGSASDAPISPPTISGNDQEQGTAGGTSGQVTDAGNFDPDATNKEEPRGQDQESEQFMQGVGDHVAAKTVDADEAISDDPNKQVPEDANEENLAEWAPRNLDEELATRPAGQQVQGAGNEDTTEAPEVGTSEIPEMAVAQEAEIEETAQEGPQKESFGAVAVAAANLDQEEEVEPDFANGFPEEVDFQPRNLDELFIPSASVVQSQNGMQDMGPNVLGEQNESTLMEATSMVGRAEASEGDVTFEQNKVILEEPDGTIDGSTSYDAGHEEAANELSASFEGHSMADSQLDLADEAVPVVQNDGNQFQESGFLTDENMSYENVQMEPEADRAAQDDSTNPYDLEQSDAVNDEDVAEAEMEAEAALENAAESDDYGVEDVNNDEAQAASNDSDDEDPEGDLEGAESCYEELDAGAEAAEQDVDPDSLENLETDELGPAEEQSTGSGSPAGESQFSDGEFEGESHTDLDDAPPENPLAIPGKKWKRAHMDAFRMYVRTNEDLFDFLGRRGIMYRERVPEVISEALKLCLRETTALRGKTHAMVFMEAGGTPLGPFLAFLALTVQSTMNTAKDDTNLKDKHKEDEVESIPPEEIDPWDELDMMDDFKAPPAFFDVANLGQTATDAGDHDCDAHCKRPEVATNIMVVMFLQAILESSRAAISGPTKAYLEWTFIPQELEINSGPASCRDENEGSLHEKRSQRTAAFNLKWEDVNPLEYVSIGVSETDLGFSQFWLLTMRRFSQCIAGSATFIHMT